MSELIAKDIDAIARIDAVPSILEIACRITGLRFAAVARVTDTKWIACAVRDELEFGLAAGGELDLKTTICDEIRDARKGVVIDHVSQDPHFRNHHTPRIYGFESYISIPILRRNGTFFGTLCALDPLPARVSDPGIVATFENFARLIGLQLELQDDLDHKEAELASAGSTAVVRERFIAILGHDLRNPVAAIVAGTTMLGKMESRPRATMILDRMNQSARRIGLLIDDLLDFARGRLGSGLALRTQVVDRLGIPIEGVIEELQVVHPDHTIELVVDLREPVTCDVERITQLLSNLVSNALVHGPDDESVKVSAESGDGQFRLSVVNGGPAIPDPIMATLFQPFTHSTDGTPRDGLGLGLFIAHEIAKAHGGVIEVSSLEGETRFTLSMPCAC